MMYKVLAIQKNEYKETLVAKFNTFEEATIYCGMILHACENTTVEISIIGGETDVDKDN